MAEHDDGVARRYRELAREEPPARVDAAILAAARRTTAPAASRVRNRWMGPVSIAAVLVLGVGLVLRMQVEEPGIATAPPAASSSAEYPVPLAAEAPAKADEAPVARAREDAAAASKPLEAAPLALPRAKSSVHEAPSREAASPAPAPRDPDPAPSASAPAAVPAAPESRPAETVPAPARAKREAAADRAASLAAPEAPKDAREVELERIAGLREAGRHDEADRALEAFRRKFPDYRIPAPLAERVMRR